MASIASISIIIKLDKLGSSDRLSTLRNLRGRVAPRLLGITHACEGDAHSHGTMLYHR